MTIRSATPFDDAAIAAVHQQAFARPNEARVVERIRQSERYLPTLSLVAEQDGAIVGHILFSLIDLVNNEIVLPVLGLAPLAVHPGWQHQGIGSALVLAGLTSAAATDAPLIVVLGHPSFYQRFGFEPASQFGITAPFPVPDEAFMVKWLKPQQDSGDRYQGRVIYPAAFQEV
ncbi:N-acetyltransferase [Oculatella sp. LEGE 06141]|uniref:GNAT family N-acetyltransferase n=1 Tax=Oculatella sp. LEGE 06141 TaxID=1828648 RepID=UPI0018800C82|nr:N-acetyltransferase [Oculatella sp. LEGE 06141]MBE9179829.1 N-acetyltransferase [Oculatella sp. LEGE 06141]